MPQSNKEKELPPHKKLHKKLKLKQLKKQQQKEQNQRVKNDKLLYVH